MRHVMAALLHRVRDERGFTMVTVMAVMFSVTLLSVAALSAAQGDLKPGAHDKSRKIAYAAAEAGVQNYLYHLAQDPNYWAKCTTGAGPHAINDPWNGVMPAADPRTWRALPDSRARYTIELLPASGAACSVADPDTSMIDADSGTFKIRATGEDVADGVKRSLVATFKRRSFLDYLYFTDRETQPSALYAMNIPSRVTREKTGAGRDFVTWARQDCDRYWGDDPALGSRHVSRYVGEYQRSDGTWVDMPNPSYPCNELQFKAGDVIAGPLHTNDELDVECDAHPAVQFGDSIDDAIETSSLGQTTVTPADPEGGWKGCTSSFEPKVNFAGTWPARPAGTWKPRSAPLQLPLTNASLRRDADPAYRFVGTTRITMNGTTMNVDGVDMAIPADGVVYVSNDPTGSCPSYDAVDAAAAPPACGNLELEGDYSVNVTFAAENDILVTEDIRRSSAGSPFLLGLIATNYVRVDHPAAGCVPALTCNVVTGCTNAAGSPSEVSIAGAILSLTKSFIVDNWFCGAPLGTLTVHGAIAQKHRGPVGRIITGPHAGPKGYVTKSYSYDDRLKYRSPPKFLDPVQAQWRVQTFSEQVPAR